MNAATKLNRDAVVAAETGLPAIEAALGAAMHRWLVDVPPAPGLNVVGSAGPCAPDPAVVSL